jgi:hypothetical protein
MQNLYIYLMKPICLILLLLCLSFASQAQKPVVIQVEKLEKPKQTLRTLDYKTILEDLIRIDHGFSRYPLGQKHVEPGFNIVAKSKNADSLVTFGYHPFYAGMLDAYANHRPFTLSPDMMWLLICQGFASHVNATSEDLRSMFVNFKGVKTLEVQNDNIDLNNPDSPWEEVFPEFSKQISAFTGPELTNAMTADFTTTTPITKMASQITLLEAMKSYFEFVVVRIGCGIPQVTLEGSPADWQKVLTKTQALRKYKLDWWVDKLEPVLKQIVQASKGKKDVEFWQTMYKWHSQKKYGAPIIVDGWIVKFFPYDKFGTRNNLDSLTTDPDKLPNEIVKVDIKYKDDDGKGHVETTPLELWAGFVGLKQNKTNFNLKPEIGWMIRKKDVGNTDDLTTKLKQQASSTGAFSGINLRTKTFPKELLAIGPINSLVLNFTDEVDVPDAISEVRIASFRIYGKIDNNGISRIRKLLPQTALIINNTEVR